MTVALRPTIGQVGTFSRALGKWVGKILKLDAKKVSTRARDSSGSIRKKKAIRKTKPNQFLHASDSKVMRPSIETEEGLQR